MKSEDLCRKFEKSLKNVIIMTVEAGIMLLFGIVITFFDAAVEKATPTFDGDGLFAALRQ